MMHSLPQEVGTEVGYPAPVSHGLRLLWERRMEPLLPSSYSPHLALTVRDKRGPRQENVDSFILRQSALKWSLMLK